MSNLVPTNGLDEAFRIDLARTDLLIIADQAHDQVAVHEAATRAATDVVHAVSAMEVPNRGEIIDLKRSYETPDADEDGPATLSSFARTLVKPKDASPVKVSDNLVKADVLSALHPDKHIGTADTSQDNLFKSVTEAQQNKDEILTQGLYASTVASRAVEVEKPSAKKLEVTRYKAYLALQAGKGRFETVEEVEAWKERELAIAPHQIRASLLDAAAEIFTQALGATEDGSMTLPIECHAPVSSGFDTTQRVVRKFLVDEPEAEDLVPQADLERFDEKLTGLVTQLKEMLDYRALLAGAFNWRYVRSAKAAQIGREFASVAQTLEGTDRTYDLDSFALSGLSKGLFGQDFEAEPSPKPHDDKYIIPNKYHKNPGIIYYNGNDNYNY